MAKRLNSQPAPHLLVTWIGQSDLNASAGLKDAGKGPIGQAVTQRSYDRVVLLCNYPKKDAARFVAWLEQQSSTKIELNLVDLTSPTHFGEIYNAVTRLVGGLLHKCGADARLTYHLSPGTPAMAAVWIIVAKTRFAAELIESSREHGVRTATVPFDIAAEFVPGMFSRPDAELTRLAIGEVDSAPEFAAIVHRSPQMKRVVARARTVAPRSITVLIEGESGTGKELLARAIHQTSDRRDKPFVAVNCGAVASELADSEFFGHKKGSFTGAFEDRKGYFQTAHQGTLFLDEIGEMPPPLQVKLLRALQERKVTRVGESMPITIDVRVIAATNRSLTKEVAEGRFREDLFYRLAIAVIQLPALRERRGDLGLLIDELLARSNEESASEPSWQQKKLSAGARNLLLQHPWPGNVRELANTLTRLAVWSSGETITEQDVRDMLLGGPAARSGAEQVLNQPLGEGIDLQDVIAEVARHYLERAMAEAQSNKSRAADLLKLGSYQTLTNWLKRYGLEK
jgi:DNA-binding NtrC family response regulator